MTTKEKSDEEEVLIWLDQNIKHEQADCCPIANILRQISNRVLFYTDPILCIDAIRTSINENIFLIVSGLLADQVLSDVHLSQFLDSVYIFCKKKQKYEYLYKKSPQLIGIYTSRSSLKNALEENIRLVRRQAFTLTLFDQKQKLTKDLTKEATLFLWFQILIDVLKKSPHVRLKGAKKHMIDLCKNYYRSNHRELEKIKNFEETYQSDHAIKWYTDESFVYRLINEALRTENLELLFLFRFYLVDLSAQLLCLSEKQKNMFDTLYRGQTILEDEFETIRNNIGSLFSVNSFFSTTTDINIAMSFLTRASRRKKDKKTVKVLFRIRANQSNSKSIVFADIQQYSVKPNEKEVLFNMATVFKIGGVTYADHLDSWQIDIQTTDQGPAQLQAYTKVIEQELEETNPTILLGSLLIDIGSAEYAQFYFEFLLKTPSEHYENLPDIYHNLGRAIRALGDFWKALEYYKYAYEIRKDRQDQLGIAKSLIGLGYLYYAQGYLDQAIEYNQQGIHILTRFFSSADHNLIGLALGNIGNVYYSKRQYDIALNYFQENLRMYQRLFPNGHHYMKLPLINIGNVHRKMKNYNLAFEYYYKALDLCEKHLPQNSNGQLHICLQIAPLHKKLGEYKSAFHMYEKVLSIQQSLYPSNHPQIVQTRSDMRDLLNKKEGYL